MSGKRQHYLPQFLLRGFLSQSKKGKQRAFVFRKNKTFSESSIKDIAVESRFYECHDASADEAITNVESGYAAAINCVRSDGKISAKNRDMLVDFVDHLVIRSKHSRDMMIGATSYLVDSAQNKYLSPVNLSAIVAGVLSDEALLDQAVEEIMDSVPNPDRALISKLVADRYKKVKHLMHRDLFEASRAFGPAFFSGIKNNVNPKVSATQISTLKKGHAKTHRLDTFLKLDWRVIKYDKPSLILGDVAVFGVNKKGEAVPPLFEGDLIKVFLPLKSDMLLVGEVDGFGFELLPSELNLLSASMSINLFVSAFNSGETERCMRFIGTKSTGYYREIVDNIVSFSKFS